MLFKICCLLLLIFSECLTMKITRLEVPASVRLSAGVDQLVLGCDYEVESDEGLQVRWYFNDQLVYQWVEGEGPAVAPSILRDNLDLTYPVPGGLRILRPLPQFSGVYTCRVSTVDSEAVQQQHLQLYEPGSGPMLHYVDAAPDADSGEETVNIDCNVAGVYPIPELTIAIDGEAVDQTLLSSETAEGRYDVSTSTVVPSAQLSAGVELRCELSLPGIPYVDTDRLSYAGRRMRRSIDTKCLATITRLEVPAVVQLGAEGGADEGQDVLVLGCEYEVECDEGLVVTWYHNDALVYQWIKSGNYVSAAGILKTHIDDTYNVSGGLRILDPLPEFSGEYKCKVSTFDSEDVQHKHLQFYDPGEGPSLSYEEVAAKEPNEETTEDEADASGSLVKLDCEVSEVFPEPELTIMVDGEVVNQTLTSTNSSEGRYNVSTTATVSVAAGTELRCELSLPGAPYNKTESLTYAGGAWSTAGPPAAEVEADGASAATVGAGSPWAAGGAAAVGRAGVHLLLASVLATSVYHHLLGAAGAAAA